MKTVFPFQVYSFKLESLYYNNDLDLESENRINNIEESNIGIHINNHPFSFYLFSKTTGDVLFDTTHSVESSNYDHYFYYAKGYIQISTRLPKGHYTYGLGERFGNLKLKNGVYNFWARDNHNTIASDDNDKFYSSIPNFITINPKTNNAYGAVMFNSSPMEVLLKEDYLTYKLTSGILELYIFSGPRPKEIILQNQETFGRPILPPYSALGWHGVFYLNEGNDINKLSDSLLSAAKGNNKILPWEGIWLDNYYDLNDDKVNATMSDLNALNYTFYLNKYSPVPETERYENYEIAKDICIKDNVEIYKVNIPLGKGCFVDYFHPDSLSYIKKTYIGDREFNYDHRQVTLYMNEPSQICPNCENNYQMEYIPANLNLSQNTIPLTATQHGNLKMIDTHNLYALTETKTYYTALNDIGITRPLIFSRSYFSGMQQYAGKWMGLVENSWMGLHITIIQTLNFNV
jgi:alpha-glucosidase (family GH31 glycosyl hydrolase)